MKKILISCYALTALLFVTNCRTNFDTDVANIKASKGNADFSKYIALGNSLTSGYRDGALYIDGQNESYPSMIAKQMQLVGGGSFKQPLMSDNLGGIPSAFVGNKLVLKVRADGSLSPAPVPATGTGTTTLANIYSSGPYQNMGVPGAKSYHLIAPGYGNPANLPLGLANPYFVRFASAPNKTVLEDAMAQAPTFFSLWIGNNDVLSYSTSGGTNSTTTGGVTTYTPAVDQTGNTNPATYKSNDISDPNVVAGSIKAILDGMKSVGATKGIIANIPYVTSIPYFTTIRYNQVPLSSASVTKLNGNFGTLNAILTGHGMAARFATLTASNNNPILIVDNSLTDISSFLPPQYAAYGQARHATAEDLILLTASSIIGIDVVTGLPATETSTLINGVSVPLADRLVLTKTETAKVIKAVDAYNASIASLASTYGLALVDANSKMKELASASGLVYDGVTYTTKFITGGSFSLDGVHLNGRGYAVIANEFIKQINKTYGSTLPSVEVNNYSGVTFP